jgi:hypothetical protein
MLGFAVTAVAGEEAMPKNPDPSAMMSKEKKDKMMKDCMKEQSSMHSDMSKSDMQKACEDKMAKMQKEHEGMMTPKSPQ